MLLFRISRVVCFFHSHCSIFKMLLLLVDEAFLLYHISFNLSSAFFKFFQIFSRCSLPLFVQQLFYYITSLPICQVLFSFFPFSNLLFCDTSASAFLRQPSYYITSKQVCQYLFRNFFSAPVNFFSLSPDKLPFRPRISAPSFDSFIIISLFNGVVKENFERSFFIFL